MIAWAAELSWGLEAPFKGTTVVDLNVKVPPVVLGKKEWKKIHWKFDTGGNT